MSIASWVEDVVERVGEPGVGALIALENVFPPIPSEVILPFAGFQAADGDLNAIGAWVAATIGALVGAWFLYGVGAVVGYERLYDLAGKRWFVILNQKDLERGRRFFDAHGVKIVLLGRCVPLVRSVVSVPAGLDRMPLVPFTIFTAIGSGIWNAVFIGLGWQLGDRWDTVENWLKPIGYVVVVLILAGLVFTLTRKVRSMRRTSAV